MKIIRAIEAIKFLTQCGTSQDNLKTPLNLKQTSLKE